MSGEVWAVLGVGVALAATILPALAGIRRDVVRLGEPLARVEGVTEGWLIPPPPPTRETPR